MKVTILGSGTILASVNRTTPAYLLEIDDKKFLIDTGPDILHQLARNVTKITDINGIFYTHFHTDHIDGLMPFLVSLYVTGMFKKLFKQQETVSSLVLHGPLQFNAFFDNLQTLHGNFLSDFLANMPRREFGDGDVSEVDGLQIFVKHVEHTDNSIGYRFTHNKKTVVFSGDSGFCDGLISLVRNADVAIFECATPSAYEMPDHLSPRKCGQIATQANVKKLILSHIYPQTESFQLLDECKKYFSGEVNIGFDGMIIEV
jgi:ribonuclease BN (tRNA processing enzyme)